MKSLTLIYLLLSAISASASNSINATMTAPTTDTVTVVESGNDKELQWVDEHIKAILPARVGISDGFINSLIDPMKYKIPERKTGIVTGVGSTLLAPPKLGSTLQIPTIVKVVEEPLKLQALMNKAALINGKWYRLNDAVRSYSLSEIKSSSVMLRGNKGEPLILFLSKNNNNIKIQTK
ncbi:MAG: hypothetical protein PHW18_05010 [Sulfuricurvum sp.]|uniref:hypothetical protein n=1 Tax=Sulfuricurvum sp. TaxID=2025608 RepID=UPI002619F416|nr:hypothetical protein [Sulfuricurvum sp.]MDD2828914.1 hypothetical protein [Sulfuricurvum sp.]MDD4948577.1 hypothetical protein [Sulfuricurvum sp.]